MSDRESARRASRANPGAAVVVLGASAKPERYSFRAVQLLRTHGFRPIPIHPAQPIVDGISALPSLSSIEGAVDTITVYLSPAHSTPLFAAIRDLRPRRVIFNPGAENPELAEFLRHEGILVIEACTLVMLGTDQF